MLNPPFFNSLVFNFAYRQIKMLSFFLKTLVHGCIGLYTMVVKSLCYSTASFACRLHSLSEVVEKGSTNDVNAQHSHKTFFILPFFLA